MSTIFSQPLNMCKRYLLWFAQEHVDFRYPEMQSLLSLFKIQMKWVEKPTQDTLYWIVELPSEECARQLSSRSMSLRWCIELWGRSKSQDLLHLNMKESLTNTTIDSWHSTFPKDSEESKTTNACPRNIMEPYFTKDKSFKITVETFCKHFTLSEKVKKIETFVYMPMEGSIKLKDPDNELIYLEYYGSDPNSVPDDPHDLFFGRVISEGQRQLIKKLSLKTRKFIGNTSMDAQLSVLMANQTQIRNGDTVIDPFVGSGSLLVASAEFGGFVWGSDIDYQMLHGKTRPTRVKQKERGQDESVRANMCQYKTQNHYLDVMVSDFSLPLWRDSMRFDAIITDPPYGIREATEKIGIERENYTLTPQQLLNHFPAKVEYGLSNIYSDLLSFSAKHLELGRRLVCWFPLYREDYTESILPTHSCLKLVANSEQVLSQYTSRRLLTYEKIKEPSIDDVEVKPLCNVTTPTQLGSEQIEVSLEKSAGTTSDFRERYFNSGDLSRKEKKEQRANDKARGQIEKALRLKRKLNHSSPCCGTYNIDSSDAQ